jgi:NADH:ubiquinone oxidoreductase subunit F (NADH-binding)/Na+-translocating ferredoxin:NAD+ oxidoreductase RnfD subunit
MVRNLRARFGAKWMVVALLTAPALFGVWHFGARAGGVLVLSVLVCLVASVLPRALRGEPFVWLNPGSIITGTLLGLTLSAGTPLYMVVVGALVAELPGKYRLMKRRRPLINPAVLGRSAVALLEMLDPPAFLDALSGASVLFKDAGGHAAPSLLSAFLGMTRGAIGETSVLVLGLVAVPMLAVVVVKRSAPLALLIATPCLVAVLPSSAAIAGHAPWVLDPAYFLLGSATLLNATFFCTDPSTTPDTHLGGVLFGVGAAVIGVLGRLYTEIPGAEMYGILVMNVLTPGLDGLARRLRAPRRGPELPAARGEAQRRSSIPFGFGLHLFDAPDQRADTPPGLALVRARADAAAAEAEVQAAGIGGCGGSGYPAVRKWAAARLHEGPRRLIVNAQEGEPGTHKDRYLLEHYALQVMTGAAVVAHLIEADRVDVVVDPAFAVGFDAVEAAWRALQQQHTRLPALQLHRGPGLYVAGEETALIAFLEGRHVEPAPRPPYPSERGLNAQPTVVHNVETLAWIALAVAQGAQRCRGHRLVTLSGAVARPGVYAAPAGLTLDALVALGGGATAPVQAFAVGGPSGGLLPAHLGGVVLAAGPLAAQGAMLGAGAVEVLGPERCVVHEALWAARFFRDASCGRCTPCRVGTVALARHLAELAAGTDEAPALAQIIEVLGASICGLGVGAANRVASVQRHWPERLRAHAQGEGCPVCQTSR